MNREREDGMVETLKIGDRVKRVAGPDESASVRKHFAQHASLGTVVEIRKHGRYGVAWDERHGTVYTADPACLVKVTSRNGQAVVVEPTPEERRWIGVAHPRR